LSIIDWPLKDWLDNVALGALSSKETLLATYDLARNVIERGVPGDFVECGVFGGAQCAVMARAIMNDHWGAQGEKLPRSGFPRRRVHLFDSFQGVPQSGPHDQEWNHEPGISICSLGSVKAHMAEWGIPEELLVYHGGWFMDTIPDATTGFPDFKDPLDKVALLRLDGDLYESTKVCTEHLYPLVSPGGWIIVDDFALSGARKAYLESVGDTGPAYFKK
jgi:O-methyltransferase